MGAGQLSARLGARLHRVPWGPFVLTAAMLSGSEAERAAESDAAGTLARRALGSDAPRWKFPGKPNGEVLAAGRRMPIWLSLARVWQSKNIISLTCLSRRLELMPSPPRRALWFM